MKTIYLYFASALVAIMGIVYFSYRIHTENITATHQRYIACVNANNQLYDPVIKEDMGEPLNGGELAASVALLADQKANASC